jgi:hypothetical protein
MRVSRELQKGRYCNCHFRKNTGARNCEQAAYVQLVAARDKRRESPPENSADKLRERQTSCALNIEIGGVLCTVNLWQPIFTRLSSPSPIPHQSPSR